MNTASVSDLESLPGIGPRRAQAIVETRAAGRLASFEDLEEVPGIGPATRERLARWLEWRPSGGASGGTEP